MQRPTKLRLIGGAILLFNLWLIGRYDLRGVAVLLLTFGFAAAYEFLLVRPLSRSRAPIDERAHATPDEASASEPIPTPQVKTSEIDPSSPEANDDHWARALSELHSNARRQGLWARAFAEAQGNESKAQANYLAARAHELAREDMQRELQLERSAQQAQRERRQADLVEPIETGVIGDRPYAMFRDGSVEIETIWGAKRRFHSMQAALEYIGQ